MPEGNKINDGLRKALESVSIIDSKSIIKELEAKLTEIKERNLCHPDDVVNADLKDIKCEPKTITPDERAKGLADGLQNSGKIADDFNGSFSGTDPNPSNGLAVATSNKKCSEECSKSLDTLAVDIKKDFDINIIPQYDKIKSKVVNFFINIIKIEYDVLMSVKYVDLYTESKTNKKFKIEQVEVLVQIDAIKAELNKKTYQSPYSVLYRNILVDKLSQIQTTIREQVTKEFKSAVFSMQDKDNQIRTVKKLVTDYEAGMIDSVVTQMDEKTLKISVQRSANADLQIGLIANYFKKQSRSPNQSEIENGTYVDNITNESLAYISNELKNTVIKFGTDIKKLLPIFETLNEFLKTDKEFKKQYPLTISDFIKQLDEVTAIYEMIEPASIEKNIMVKLSKTICCGKAISDGKIPDDEQSTVKFDLNHKTFTADRLAEITKLRYWKLFSVELNKIALLPQYYTTGLLVPTPTGIFKVPLPIIWKPLAVIPTATSITVIFLTINGVILYPVVYQLRFPPLGDSESYFNVLFKGGNVLIKSKTSVAVANPPIVAGIDTNPALTKSLPYKDDDLCVPERMRAYQNPQFTEFLRKWCSTANKTYMGFP